MPVEIPAEVAALLEQLDRRIEEAKALRVELQEKTAERRDAEQTVQGAGRPDTSDRTSIWSAPLGRKPRRNKSPLAFLRHLFFFAFGLPFRYENRTTTDGERAGLLYAEPKVSVLTYKQPAGISA